MTALRTPVCASLVAQTMPTEREFRICPGIERSFRLALVEDDGGTFIPLSEHDTPEAACDARDHAKAAAADALIALSEIGRASV